MKVGNEIKGVYDYGYMQLIEASTIYIVVLVCIYIYYIYMYICMYMCICICINCDMQYLCRKWSRDHERTLGGALVE